VVCPTCQSEMTYLHASNMDGRLFHCGQCGHLRAQDSHVDVDVVPAQAKSFAAQRRALAGLLGVIVDSDQREQPSAVRLLGIVSGRPEFAAVDAARAALAAE
jgi:hypothetical protein